MHGPRVAAKNIAGLDRRCAVGYRFANTSLTEESTLAKLDFVQRSRIALVARESSQVPPQVANLEDKQPFRGKCRSRESGGRENYEGAMRLNQYTEGRTVVPPVLQTAP